MLRIYLTSNFSYYNSRAPPWSSGSVLDHRSLPPVFESRRGHVWRLFHLWIRFITFGGRSAHLAYLVYKPGRKTLIIIIIIIFLSWLALSFYDLSGYTDLHHQVYIMWQEWGGVHQWQVSVWWLKLAEEIHL